MSSATASTLDTTQQAGSAGMFRDVASRRYAIQLGVWCFLATVTMLFAAFSSSYIVRQSGTDWQATPMPGILWMNTLLLVASSISLEISRHEARKGNLKISRSSLATTILLAIGGALFALLVPDTDLPVFAGALIGAFLGLVIGFFASGIVLMIYRGLRHFKGKHD